MPGVHTMEHWLELSLKPWRKRSCDGPWLPARGVNDHSKVVTDCAAGNGARGILLKQDQLSILKAGALAVDTSNTMNPASRSGRGQRSVCNCSLLLTFLALSPLLAGEGTLPLAGVASLYARKNSSASFNLSLCIPSILLSCQ